MNWRDYFINGDGNGQEEMYQAFKERMEAESIGESIDDDFESEADREERLDREEKYSEFEKNEYYRKEYAKKHGYKFKPKEFIYESKKRRR